MKTRETKPLDWIENALTDLAARVAPWLSPLPTAYLVGRATMAHLAWPMWVAIVAAAIVEVLGLSAVNTALWLRQYNASRRKIDPPAPTALAVVLAGIYFVVAVTLTVVLDIVPDLAVIAPAIFPGISLCGMTVLALRSDHRRRLETIAADRAERSASRASGHVARTVTGQMTGQAMDSDRSGGGTDDRLRVGGVSGQDGALTALNAQRHVDKGEAMARLLGYLTDHPDASYREAGIAVGRSKSWTVGAVDELEAAGRLRKNGNGWEVVNLEAMPVAQLAGEPTGN